MKYNDFTTHMSEVGSYYSFSPNMEGLLLVVPAEKMAVYIYGG
jgi:hypothetical protein